MAAPSALPSALRWPVDVPCSPLPSACSFQSASRRGGKRFHVLLPRCSSSPPDAPTSSASSSAPSSRSSSAGAFSPEGLHPTFKDRTKNPIDWAGDRSGLIQEHNRGEAFLSRSYIKRSEGKSADPTPGRSRSFMPNRRRPLWRRILFASKKVRSIILLDVLTVIYASDIPILKEVEAAVDPSLFNMIRFATAAIPFLPFVLWFRGDTKTRSFGIELGLWASLGYFTQALGLLTSGAGRASFLSAFMVITVPLIDGLLGSTVPFLTWWGALLSLAGVCLLECSGPPPDAGDFFNLLSAVFFGVHMLRTEHISRVTKKESYLSLLGYQMSVIALFSVGWYLLRAIPFSGERASWDWITSFPWIPALYTGILTTGLCLWAEMSAMRDVSASETAIIYGLEPLWGAAFAWILLGERWDVVGWVGAALILCGSLTVQIFGSASEKPKGDDVGISDRSKDLSLSPVVINSRRSKRVG